MNAANEEPITGPTCSICAHAYDERVKEPKVLSCGHTYCGPCLTRHRNTRRAAGHQFTCPECRERVRGLKPNFGLLRRMTEE